MKQKAVLVIGSLLFFGVAALTLAVSPRQPTPRTQAHSPAPAQVAPSPFNRAEAIADLERKQRENEEAEKRNQKRLAEIVANAPLLKQQYADNIDRSTIPAPLKGVTKGLINYQIDRGIKKLTAPQSPTREEMEHMSKAELNEVLKQVQEDLAQAKREKAQAEALRDAAKNLRETVRGVTGK